MTLPADVPVDTPEDQLPELPDGYVWGLVVTAEAEVIPASTTSKEQ